MASNALHLVDTDFRGMDRNAEIGSRMLILSTVFLIDVVEEKKKASIMLFDFEQSELLLCTTEVNALELLEWASISPNREETMRKVKEVLEPLIILPVQDGW